MRQLILILALFICGFGTNFRRDVTLLYGVGGTERNRQLVDIADRYSLGVSGSSSDYNIIRAINPNFKWLIYVSAEDNYVTGTDTAKHDWLTNQAIDSGLNPEIFYMHYYDDTQIILEGDTLTILGWGGGSATSEEDARVPVYYANKSRILNCYSNAAARRFVKKYHVNQMKNLPSGSSYGYADGLFWDNSACRLYNYGSVLSGGHIAEEPSHKRIDSIGLTDADYWWTSLNTFFTELNDTFELSASWSVDGKRKYTALNIVNSWATSMSSGDIGDYMFMEFIYSPITYHTSSVATSYTRDSTAAANGVSLIYSPVAYTSYQSYTGTYTFKDALTANMCWFYITASDSACFFQQNINAPGTVAWDTLTWCGSMDFNVGDPLGKYTTAATGTDGAGYTYTIFTRNYENAKIYMRPRGNWNQNMDTTTAVTLSLGGTYKQLLSDGTFGAAVSATTLRNGQARIFVDTGYVSVDLQPENDTVTDGETAMFFISASGSSVSYQWYLNNKSTPISGATNDTLSFTVSSVLNGNYYFCRVTNTTDTAWSDSALLVVLGIPENMDPKSAKYIDFTVRASQVSQTTPAKWLHEFTIPYDSLFYVDSIVKDSSNVSVCNANDTSEKFNLYVRYTRGNVCKVFVSDSINNSVDNTYRISFDTTLNNESDTSVFSTNNYSAFIGFDSSLLNYATNRSGSLRGTATINNNYLRCTGLNDYSRYVSQDFRDTGNMTIVIYSDFRTPGFSNTGRYYQGGFSAGTFDAAASSSTLKHILGGDNANSGVVGTWTPAGLHSLIIRVKRNGYSRLYKDGVAGTENFSGTASVGTYNWTIGSSRDSNKTINADIYMFAMINDTLTTGAMYDLDKMIRTPTILYNIGTFHEIYENIDSTITQQPHDTTVNDGEIATFTIAGDSITSYQWYGNDSLIAGATSSTYTFTATYALNGSTIYCIVNGTLSSDTVTLTVLPVKPTIIQHPSNKNVAIGKTATFTVSATGTIPLSFQWQLDSINISGATNPTYTTPATDSTYLDNDYRVIVSNLSGNDTSNNVRINFNATTGSRWDSYKAAFKSAYRKTFK